MNGRRHYFNINLHDKEQKQDINQGIIRINDSFPAEKMEYEVEKHLNFLGVSLKNDIVSSTNNGAGVTVKFCQIIPPITQLC